MAKRQSASKTADQPAAQGGFQFETLSREDYEQRTRRTGSGRGRKSKYTDIGAQAEALQGDQVLAFVASKSEVQGVRNYVRRNYGEAYNVQTSAASDGKFNIYLSRKAEG